MSALPIDDVLPSLLAALDTRSVAVLEAPPGAGKTTRVPLALLDATWLGGARIVMLEPRRLAARSAATYMARQLGEQVGETVGYRVRGESRVSRSTRIEVITEGVLNRLLADDPTLDGIGALIFDEFHERSLNSDLGLALALETQHHLRPELRLIVMSATLDGASVAELLADGSGPAPGVRSDGALFPVHTEYRAPRAGEWLEAHTARVVKEAVLAHAGDVLVFLPGAREIRGTAQRLQAWMNDGTFASLETRLALHTLMGSLSLAEQDAAVAPSSANERKIVLATDIAETSLTIEGVRVVIDAGRTRRPRFDARVGLTRLETVRVSMASADQRRGRAGRVAPGVCYRLWDMQENAALLPRSRAEIVDADLTPLALELAAAGVTDANTLRWLDVPSPVGLASARELLTQLGALDLDERITAHGREMLALPAHPRLSHMMLVARADGRGTAGANVAAILEERDLLRTDGGPPPADLRLRMELLQSRASGDGDRLVHGASVDRDALRRIRDSARDLRSRTNSAAQLSHDDVADVGELIALAFPDRIARRRVGHRARYLMHNGSGVALNPSDALTAHEFLAVAELAGAPPEFRIARAAPLDEAVLRTHFAGQLSDTRFVEWDESVSRIVARRRTMLGAIVLDDAPLRDVTPHEKCTVLLQLLRTKGIAVLPLGNDVRHLRERLGFVSLHEDGWPSMTDEALLGSAAEWLAPMLAEVSSFAELREAGLVEALLSQVPWAARARLEQLAPTHITVPSGSRLRIDYADSAAPVLAVKLQEVFGWTATPMIFNGRIPLTLHLLSPAQRPVQVTQDLAGFWRTGYFDVRKELRGRYPRHPWPEDPLTAQATRRTKSR